MDQNSKERLEHYREGLLYGSGVYNGDVFEAALNLSDEKLGSRPWNFVILKFNHLELLSLS